MTAAAILKTQIDAREMHGRVGCPVIEPLQFAVFDLEPALLEQPADKFFIIRLLCGLQRVEAGNPEASVGQALERQTRVDDDEAVDFQFSPEQRQQGEADPDFAQPDRRLTSVGGVHLHAIRLGTGMQAVPIGVQRLNVHHVTGTLAQILLELGFALLQHRQQETCDGKNNREQHQHRRRGVKGPAADAQRPVADMEGVALKPFLHVGSDLRGRVFRTSMGLFCRIRGQSGKSGNGTNLTLSIPDFPGSFFCRGFLVSRATSAPRRIAPGRRAVRP